MPAQFDVRGKMVETGLALKAGLRSPSVSVPSMCLEGMDSPFLQGTEDLGAGSAALGLAPGLLDTGWNGGPSKAKLAAQKTLVLSDSAGPELLLKGLLLGLTDKGTPTASPAGCPLTPVSPGRLPRAVGFTTIKQPPHPGQRGSHPDKPGLLPMRHGPKLARVKSKY